MKKQSDEDNWRAQCKLVWIKVSITVTLVDVSNFPDVTTNEIVFGLKNVKCRKSLGKDNIVTDLLKDEKKTLQRISAVKNEVKMCFKICLMILVLLYNKEDTKNPLILLLSKH